LNALELLKGLSNSKNNDDDGYDESKKEIIVEKAYKTDGIPEMVELLLQSKDEKLIFEYATYAFKVNDTAALKVSWMITLRCFVLQLSILRRR